ncbi:MAG: Asp-tRNA(Asn)/Glu-tRNA(Gln) amidotransferase subunit GatA [Acidobacteria bacterium]|nr:Asp-tRNA(Asn)/Glu-tRNA(Gln) amidotransferase subunit GatA [Acidobacteriota bacterium]MBI3656964.1 Asp-tRNA(Asn)/Glu-tRNA(Gln) amidotransferase subunit GatA [Acidobacteriota bacterium]
MEIYELSIAELHEQIQSRRISARQACESALGRIASVENKVDAFLTVAREVALREADAVDAALAAGKPVEYLTGIPLGIKDVLCTKGLPTTCGSRILEGYYPPYDAHVIERLRHAGAVIIGKTNCDEFAMGSSTENSAYKPTRNPWNLGCVPGGSSGGSAAAVAAYECPGALGSDTGGSVRLPAAFCGVVGMKPTYGRVSRYGLVAYASSLDQIGPIARTVRDTAMILQAIAGHDRRDSTSVKVPVADYLAGLDRPLKGLRLGLPKEFFGPGLDTETKTIVESATKVLQGLGCELLTVHLPHSEYAIAAYYLIATAEASSNLARYDAVKYGLRDENVQTLNGMYMASRSKGFGAEVKRRIMLGTYALSAGYYEAYYRKAQQVRTLIKRDYEEAFKHVDVILGPTSPVPPFALGEKISDPLAMYLIDIYTVTLNLAGLPGIAVPCGFTQAGLPVGLQIIGNYFAEAMILRVAYAFEQAAKFDKPLMRLNGNR